MPAKTEVRSLFYDAAFTETQLPAAATRVCDVRTDFESLPAALITKWYRDRAVCDTIGPWSTSNVELDGCDIRTTEPTSRGTKNYAGIALPFKSVLKIQVNETNAVRHMRLEHKAKTATLEISTKALGQEIRYQVLDEMDAQKDRKCSNYGDGTKNAEPPRSRVRSIHKSPDNNARNE